MEQHRASMATTVEHLRTQLAEEQRQRAYLQENLKRVFMRGVCALNFEAMSLLSDSGITTAAAPEEEQQQQQHEHQQQQQRTPQQLQQQQQHQLQQLLQAELLMPQQQQLPGTSPPPSQRQKDDQLLKEPFNSIAGDGDRSPSPALAATLPWGNGSQQERRDGNAGGGGHGHSPSAAPEVATAWVDSAVPACGHQPQRREQLHSGLPRPVTHQASLENPEVIAAAATVATGDAQTAARFSAGTSSRSSSAVRSNSGLPRTSSENGAPNLIQREVPLPARLCSASTSYKRMVARGSGPLPFVSYTVPEPVQA